MLPRAFLTAKMAFGLVSIPVRLYTATSSDGLALEKLNADHGGRLVLEKGDDPKDLRKALKAAAGSLNRRLRFPFRGEEGAISFYLEKPRGRRPKGEAGRVPKKRGRPRKAAS